MFSVIIPNYNGKEYLKDCLGAIFRSIDFEKYRDIEKQKSKSLNIYNSISLEIIVVDNGSKDGSREYLRDLEIWKYRNIEGQKSKSLNLYNSISLKLIKNKFNLGFAKAVNQGVLAAKNDYVVVMNNDLVVEKNWFEVMREAIDKGSRRDGGDKAGCWFGKVLNQDGSKIESTGLIYELKGKAKNRNNGEELKLKMEKTKGNEKLKVEGEEEELIWGASASIVVYLKKALLEVGLFDEDFFAYEEDVDLAIRLNNSGWKTLYVPQAVSYHIGGATSQKMGNFRRRMDAKNWWFIVLKNYPASVLLKHFPEMFIERLRNLSGLLKSVPFYLWPIEFFRTYGELLLKLPKILKKRKPVGESIINDK